MMGYQLLKKLYYKDKIDYEQEYQQRFTSASTIHVDFEIHNNSAFFQITPEISFKAMNILSEDKVIYKVCKKLPRAALDWYEKNCLIEEIMLTNKIEGVHSTRQEIGEVLENLEKEDRKNRFKGLVQKYSMLMSNQKNSVKTCQDIRKIYDDLALEEIAENNPNQKPDGVIFRRDPVSVYSDTDREIHRGVYPEKKIIEDMEKALSFLDRSDVHMLFKTSVFHYLFGYIHPFYDGNGRTSRFISSVLLSRCLEPIMGYRLSYTIKEKINSYYKAFEYCNDPKNKGDLTPFVDMFLDIIYESMKQLEKTLLKRATDLKELLEQFEVIFPESKDDTLNGVYFLMVQAALFSEDGITLDTMKSVSKLSYGTLRKRLNKIDECGCLKVKKCGKANHYMLDLDKLS